MIVSHDHYDHLDYPTIRELATRDVPFVTSLGVGAHLEAWGVRAERIVELDWWESHALPNADLDGDRGAVAALLRARPQGPQRDAVVVARDSLAAARACSSAATPGSRRSTRRSASGSGPFDLVMLEVGAFHPAWGDIHLGPENALKALTLLGGGAFLPVHWGTFNLAMHAWDEPAEALLELGPKAGRATRDAAPGRAGRAGARATRSAVVASRRNECGRAGDRTTVRGQTAEGNASANRLVDVDMAGARRETAPAVSPCAIATTSSGV